MTITVSGGEQIISSLRRLSEGIPNATKAALDTSLKLGVEKAKQIVPVRTGVLQRSIHHELKSAEQGDLLAGGGNVDYAKFVEFGNRIRPARPYLSRTGLL
ncbi:MAG: HK97 gp10 family phage protein [Nitrososphaeraceae archaeon]